MRKTFLTMALLAASLLSWAQDAPAARSGADDTVGTLTLIPKAGLNFATTSLGSWVGKTSGIGKPSSGMVVGPVVGIEGEYKLQPWLSVSAALLYSMQGRKYDDSEVQQQAVADGLLPNAKGAVVRKEYHHYFNLPLTANFYVIDRLAVRTGLQLGYLFHQGGTLNTPFEDLGAYSISGSPSKFDLSIPVGVSYALENGLQFDLRYNHGLTSLSWSDGIIKEKNRVVQLTVGYRLDMQKIIGFFRR